MMTHWMTYAWSLVGILFASWASRRSAKRVPEGELGILVSWSAAKRRRDGPTPGNVGLPVIKTPGFLLVWPWQNVAKRKISQCLSCCELPMAKMKDNRSIIAIRATMTFDILAPDPDHPEWGLYRALFTEDFEVKTRTDFQTLVTRLLEKISFGTPQSAIEALLLSEAIAQFGPVGLVVSRVTINAPVESGAFQLASAGFSGNSPMPIDDPGMAGDPHGADDEPLFLGLHIVRPTGAESN